MRWRGMVAAVALVAVVALTPTEAGAWHTIGWWLKASGAVHFSADANHYVIEAHAAGGGYQGVVWDAWLDWYCQVHLISGGNNAGTPFRLWLAPPAGSGLSCLPNSDGAPTAHNQFYGWRNGHGGYSGQNWYSPWFVVEYPTVLPLRPPHELGTLIEVW